MANSEVIKSIENFKNKHGNIEPDRGRKNPSPKGSTTASNTSKNAPTSGIRTSDVQRFVYKHTGNNTAPNKVGIGTGITSAVQQLSSFATGNKNQSSTPTGSDASAERKKTIDEYDRLVAELEAKEAKYTDEYWENYRAEADARYRRALYQEDREAEFDGDSTNTSNTKDWNKYGNIQSMEEYYAAYDAWEAERTQLRAKINELEPYAEAYRGAEALSDPEFREYAEKGRDMEDNPVMYARTNVLESGLNFGGKYNSRYHHMTETEVDIYCYFLAKYGKERADQYLGAMEQFLNAREAQRRTDAITDIEDPFLEALAMVGYDLVGGAVNSISHWDDIFYDEAQDPTVYEMYNSNMDEYMADNGGWNVAGRTVGQWAHAGANTVGTMAPSIVAAYIATEAGAPQWAAGLIGAGITAMQAGGTKYSQNLRAGYDIGASRKNAIATGIAEGGLQYALTGISTLGGINNSGLMASARTIKNPLLRTAAVGGLKVGGEVLEENLQSFIEPALDTKYLGTQYKAPTWEEIRDTTIISALTTVVLEGGDIARTARNKSAYGERLLSLGDEAIVDTVEIGLKQPIDSEAHAVAKKLDAKIKRGDEVSAHEAGVLVEAIVVETGSLTIDPKDETEVTPLATTTGEAMPTTLEEAAKVVVGESSTTKVNPITGEVYTVPVETATTPSSADVTVSSSGEVTEATKNLFYGRKTGLATVDGQTYVGDGIIALPVSDAQAVTDALGSRENGKVELFVKNVTDGDFVEISSDAVVGKIEGVGEVAVFKTKDGREVAIQRKYADYLNGYNLSATFTENGKARAVKATDAEGNLVAVVKAVVPMGSNTTYGIKNSKDVASKATFKELKATENKLKAMTGFGDYGVKALAKVLSTLPKSEHAAAVKSFRVAYEAGLTNLDTSKANFATDIQRIAFMAGKQDFIMENAGKVENVKNVKSHGDKAGFDRTNAPAKVSAKALAIADKLCKAVGVKARMVGESDLYNAKIVPNEGEVLIASNYRVFENLGEDASFMLHVMHEVADHRAEELAPEAYAEFKREMYMYKNSLPNVDLADAKRNVYAAKGVDISLSEAMSEVTANSLLELYDYDLDLLAEGLDRVLNGNNAQAKKGANIFKQALDFIIEKFKKLLNKLGVAERKTYQAGLDEIIRLRDVFEKSLSAAVAQSKKNAAKTTTENLEIKTKKEYNGNTKFALKDEKWHTDLTKAQLKKVEGWLEKEGKPEAKKITDTVYWYKGRLNGEDLFVIYSTEDPKGNTILYEVKGEQANPERKILMNLLEAYENGESNNGKPVQFNAIFGGGWMQQKNGVQNNIASMGSGQNNQNDRVLQGQSERNASRALWNVLDNLFGKQGEIVPDTENTKVKHSLKDSDGNTLTKEQAEYFKDSKVRDENGSLKVVYHGTTRGGFTVFNRSYNWYTDSKETAQSYSKDDTLYEGYANITKPYVIDAKGDKWSGIAVDADTKALLEKYGSSTFRERGAWRTSTADIVAAISEAVEEGSADYDGVIILNVNDFGSWYNSKSDGIGNDYVTFSSEQFKNKDNTNPTSNPDIRYSLKDSDYLSAVEKGDMATAQRMVGEAAEEAGYPIKAYHGTPNDSFTVFDKNRTGKGNDQYGAGFYFASNEEASKSYGNRVIPSFLSVHNPIKLDGSSTDGANLINGGYDYLLTEEQAYEVIKRLPNIYDEEESPLGDYYDSYWETGAEDWMIEDLASNEANRNIGYLDSDLFRNYPNELHEAIRDVVGYDGVEVTFKNGDKFYVAWFDNQMKSAEPVTYDDNGNVIPLSERFNEEKNDIRYSLKGTEKDISLKEVAKLKETINDMKERHAETVKALKQEFKDQLKVSKLALTDKKALEKTAKAIVKEFESGADVTEVQNALNDLYTYMANGEGGNVVWNEVYSRAHDIASNVLRNVSLVDDTIYRESKRMREYFRVTPIAFNPEYGSDIAGYESLNDFRKANFGRINLTKDGVPIDSLWGEMSSLFPEYFDSEEVYHPAEMLARIEEALDAVKPMEYNPYSSNMREASAHLANDIIERFYDLPQMKTIADKAKRKVVEARIEGGNKVAKVRAEKDEKIRQAIAEGREKAKKAVLGEKIAAARDMKKMRDKYEKRIEKMSESGKAKVLRARILSHANDLSNKLLRPTDNKHIPHKLQGIVAKLLECINLESNYSYDTESHSYKKNDEGLPSRRTQSFRELQKLYVDMAAELTIDPDLMGDEGLLSEVIALSDKRIADMTASELQTVWETMQAVEATITTANRMFSDGKFEAISEVAEMLRSDNAGKGAKTELRFGGSLQKLASLDMLTPETYLHMLGEAGDSIFRMMRNAQDKHIQIMHEVADFTHKELKGVKVNKLEKKLHTVTLGGKDVQLTTAQLMELYVLMRRDQAKEHILVGGILPDVVNKGIKKITEVEPIMGIQAEEIGKALSLLSAEEKAIAEKLQKFVSTVLSRYGNEASMKVYNYEKFGERNYWTIRTNKQEIKSDIGQDTAVTTVSNRGFTKGTKPHANTSVRIGSIFDTFSAHASDMATYAAWLGTSEDVNRIRNFVFWEDGARRGTVKGILDRVHGLKGAQYLEKLLTDIAIGVKGVDDMNPFAKLTGAYKAAAVGANLRVVIQQPTAILRALDMISPQYLALAEAKNPFKGWEKAKKYAPIAQWKDWGYFDINTGRQMKDVLFDNADVVEKAKQVGMWGASKADSLSWGTLWNAVEAETKAKHKDLKTGSEDFHKAVAERFTEIVDHTQVVDGILQRSQIMRSRSDLVKMATSFMGEPTKQYNMAVSAAYDARVKTGDARKKAIGKLGRTMFALGVAGIVNAMAAALVDALRDDDKEKKYWEKWLAAFAGIGEEEKFTDSNLFDTVNVLSYIPFAKDVVSIVKGYDVKRMDTETIAKTVDAAKNMYKAITGEGKYTVGEASANLFAECARLFGLPVANLKRDIKAIAMTTFVATDNYVGQYYMEKASLQMNYSGNNQVFLDILYNAYLNDKEAYEIIYEDMINSGFDAEKIENGMNNRLKKNAGVKDVTELEKRYLSPQKEKQYDSKLKTISSSEAWKAADKEARQDAKNLLFKVIDGTDKDIVKTMEEGKEYGLDDTEYVLYKLALGMADEDDSGSYTSREKENALDNLTLGDGEIAYLWGTDQALEAYAYGIDMNAYVDFKADVKDIKKGATESDKAYTARRKKEITALANKYADSYKEYLYFMGLAYSSVKKDRDYVSYFGEQD